MSDADVQNGRAVVEEAVRGEVALAPVVVVGVAHSPELGGRRIGNIEFIRR